MPNKTFRVLPEPIGGLETSEAVPKVCFTTDDHSESSKIFYQASDGSTRVGVWECAPCRVEIANYSVDEQMVIISGSLTLTNENGEAEIFKAGDVLFVSKGSKLTLHITERLRKFYMIAS
jgi:uncharacterized cupin superfamily protein